MPKFLLPRVYPITDRRLAGLSHAEQVAQLTTGGAKLIQLREKQLEAGPFYEQARAAVRVARTHGALIIINDRVDIALAVEADGVHLGQTDLPPEAARRLLGQKAIIGFSTHNVEQAVAATGLPIDYLAIGPIFPTASKEKPDPVVGLEGLKRVRASLKGLPLPLVAIGG
ncbi:MAG: thiamine phosphate synthase, partial [Pyrinomonas sp.]|uniref:thiamine phosphate synthase n=1 Tax=Pyrinomonas sp. TaxID=2080306 RepID=UPI00332F40B9